MPRVLGGKKIEDNDNGTKTVSWSFPELPTDILEIARKELARHGEAGPSDAEVLARVSVQEVAIQKPAVSVQYKMGLYGLALAGLKVAYEFTVEALGYVYLSDAFADEARDLIVAGVPKGETRAVFCYEGGCLAAAPNVIPTPEHKLMLVRRGETLCVEMSFFGTYVGQYRVSESAFRYQPFAAREYTINAESGAARDYWLPPITAAKRD